MAPQNETKMYEMGRLAGIREAIAIVAALTVGLDRAPLLSKLQALLPPPSGGEKAECTCRKLFDGSPDLPYVDGCPVHAPHGRDPLTGGVARDATGELARKAVCGTCGGSGETEEDATGALGYVVKKPCPDCAGGALPVKGGA